MSHKAAGSSAGYRQSHKSSAGYRTRYIGGLNRVTALARSKRTTPWQAAPRFRGAGSRASLKRVCPGARGLAACRKGRMVETQMDGWGDTPQTPSKSADPNLRQPGASAAH
eukprot:scaffold1707_cov49-Phaeocystis_antarctica.AAC.2